MEVNDVLPAQQNHNGLQAFDTLEKFLETDGWYPQRIKDQYAFSMRYAGHNAYMTCSARIRVETEQLIYYIYAPIKVPEEVRLSVAEFLIRANYGLWIGNFEMDFDDGEVRYKSSLDFEGETLTSGFIHNTNSMAVRLMDLYLSGLLKIVCGR